MVHMPAIIRAKTGSANSPSQLPQEHPKYITKNPRHTKIVIINIHNARNRKSIMFYHLIQPNKIRTLLRIFTNMLFFPDLTYPSVKFHIPLLTAVAAFIWIIGHFIYYNLHLCFYPLIFIKCKNLWLNPTC